MDGLATQPYDLPVGDDPDDPTSRPAIAIGRVVTAELTVQIKAFGIWHRRLPDSDCTACGVLFKAYDTECRREVMTHADGGLCPDCFTQIEMDHALANDLYARAERSKREKRDTIDRLFKALPPATKGEK